MVGVAGDMDKVFKALADATRRRLLDSLRGESGQTLGRLCGRLVMARQSVSQHLSVLEEADLISTVWRGREKLHYLNPVPIRDIQRRWIAPFEEPRLDVLQAVKQHAEEPQMTTPKPSFVYVTYIRSTPERVWQALTDANLTANYWGHSNVSDWQAGSSWEHRRTDGSGIADVVGTVLEAAPPTRLVITFEEPATRSPDRATTVTFLIEGYHDIVRLTVQHVDLPDDDNFAAAAAGWPAVLANLKSLLETGHPLPQPPWQMHTELQAKHMPRHDPRS
jgi:uncharacterized protein YndB with AHSA1/START domain/DNA-binding transcriptional ArsR family regulator